MNHPNLDFEDQQFVRRIEGLLEARASEIDVMNRQASDRPRSEPKKLRLAKTEIKPQKQRYQYLAACAASIVVLAAAVVAFRVGQPAQDDAAPTPEGELVDEQIGEAGDDSAIVGEQGDTRPPVTTTPNGAPSEPDRLPPPPTTGLSPTTTVGPSRYEPDVGIPTADLRTVGGITVNVVVAQDLENMQTAARADGIVLSGGGYRDPSAQIAVRRQNCGPTDYDIYEKPASECQPATARPLMSSHEMGIAVDFVNEDGSTVRSGDPVFVWLKSNAARFGFTNTFPDEPWHWEHG